MVLGSLCRGRACPVPSPRHPRFRHGRPQGSPPQGPAASSCMVLGSLCRGRACPVPSPRHPRFRHGRPQGSPLQGPAASSCMVLGSLCRGRACPVPSPRHARFRHLSRPVSTSCTIPARATTRVAPTRSCREFVHARFRHGRPQGSPLQGPAASSCMVLGSLCRGRACPVPSPRHPRFRHGRPQGSPLQWLTFMFHASFPPDRPPPRHLELC